MRVSFALQLPRDALSVPVVRRILRGALQTLGVQVECAKDIELGLAEAATNVLEHAADGERYAVEASLHDHLCVIEVVDTGAGFLAEGHSDGEADLESEQGRGIQLMRAVSDRLDFAKGDDSGTVVRLEKRLFLEAGSPLLLLTGEGAAR